MNRVLLIESGKESYRAFTLEALHRDGIAIVLVAKDEPTWQWRYIVDYLAADVDAPEAFVEHVVAHAERDPVDGVLTFVERLVPLAAAVAERLGLRCPSPAAAFAARNKVEMRKCFAAAGLHVPRVVSFATARDGGADALAYPAVVKPVMGFASLNVFKIESPADLAWAETVIAKDNHPTLPHPGDAYLVEEYIDGRELSIESAVSGATLIHYGVTEKFTSAEPYFEEFAHLTPARLEDAELARVLSTAERAIRALGLDHCVTHTEVRISKAHGPVVIEVAARLGGDKIPYLTELTTGASPSLAAGRAALGRELASARSPQRHAGILFFVPRSGGTLTGNAPTTPAVEGIVEFECWARAGQGVRVPPEQFFTRLGYVVVEGTTAEVVLERLVRIVSEVERALGVPLYAPEPSAVVALAS